MKWKIPLFAILAVLAIVPASYTSATILLPTSRQVSQRYITQSATVSMTFNFYVPGLDPPTGFVLTDLEGITASANWTKDNEATYTMVRISRFDYPTTPEEGELAYYGDNESCNIPGIYFDGLVIYASAFSYESDNTTYSEEYATASIGEGMEDLTNQVEAFNTLLDLLVSSGFLLAIVSLLFGLIFWQKRVFLYALGVPVGMVYGLSLANDNDVLSALWVMGIIIAIIGTYCFVRVIEAGLNWAKDRKNE